MEVMNIALNLLEQHWKHTKHLQQEGQPAALLQHKERLQQHHQRQQKQQQEEDVLQVQQRQQQTKAVEERGPLRGAGLFFRGERSNGKNVSSASTTSSSSGTPTVNTNDIRSSSGDSVVTIEYDDDSIDANSSSSSSSDKRSFSNRSTSEESIVTSSSRDGSSSNSMATSNGPGDSSSGVDAADDPVLLKQLLEEQEQQELERNKELLAMCSRVKAVEQSLIWALEYQKTTAGKVASKASLDEGGDFGEVRLSTEEAAEETAKWYERERLRQKEALKSVATLRKEKGDELAQLQQQALKVLEGFEAVHNAHLAELQERRDWAWGPEAEKEWLAFVERWEKQLAQRGRGQQQQQQEKRLLG
jgi:hypothetical protein